MKITIQWLVTACLFLTVVACSSNTHQLHRSNDSSLPKNIGIQGYSPVSYFESNRAEFGDPAYQYHYENRVYYFTSAAQVETFKQAPEAYIPKFGEYCPYSLALGRRVAIDPQNFKIQNDELLLFHSDVELATVDVAKQQEIFDKAEHQFKLLEF